MWPFIPRVIEKFLDLANLQRHNDNYTDIKSAMEDMAGPGRTNQTIKGNSDTTAAHLADHANPHVVTAAQVGAYTKTELQTSGQSLVHWNNLTNKPNFADARWGAPVATKAALDAIVATQDGEVRLVLQDETVYEWDIEIAGANKWKVIGAIGDGLTSHSALNNLTNDDHPQYLRTDGTRILTGDQDFAQHQAKNFVGDKSATIPANPVEGQEWYDLINHRKMLYKGSLQGWVDISGKGALIKDQEFTALAGQTVFDITVGQYETSTNSISVYKKDTGTGKFELAPESEYTETNSTRFTLTSPAAAGEVFYVKFFENTPEVINQSVKRDGTLQTNLNADLLHGHDDTYFAPISKFDQATGHNHDGAAGNGPKILAANISIADVKGIITATDVEGALQEIAASYVINAMYRQGIINAGLGVAQRIAPLGSMALTSGSSAYVMDRVRSFNNGSGVNATVSQVAISDLDGAGHGLQIVHAATPTVGGKLAHTYTMEARDAYKWAGLQAVYALKVKGVGAMDQISVNARYKTSEVSIDSASTLILSTGVKPINNSSWTIIPLVVTLPIRATLTTNGVIGFEIIGSKSSAEASGEGFIISELELIKSGQDLGFQPRSFAEELALCQRYYEKSYPYGTAPATASSGLGLESKVVPSNTIAISQSYGKVSYKVKKRITPTVKVYPYTTPTNTGQVSDPTSGTNLGTNSGGVVNSGDDGFVAYNNNGASLTTTASAVIFHWDSDAEL